MADLAFEMAAQPDMVLSVEKDIYYTRQIKDQLKEIAERVLGPRRAELLDPEVRLLGDLLYYGLTLWAGAETLGQEYVGATLVQATGGGKLVPLSSPRRAALVLTTVLLLYTNKRLVSRGGWEGDFRQLATRARHPHPHLIQDPVASSEGRDSHLTQDSAVSSERREGGSNGISASTGVVRRWVMEWGRGGRHQPVITAAHDRIQVYARRVARALSAVSRGYARRVGPVVGPYVPESTEAGLRLAKRWHLMLFFLDARFYTWAHRLCGARTMATRTVREPRASYKVMGLFIALEMAIKAATTLHHATQASVAGRLLSASSPASASKPLRPDQPSEEEDEDQGVVEEPRKCALCMGPRTDPAATPCGHVYCWACILSWTTNSPECPLCRSPAPPQTILHVVNLGEGAR